MHLPAKIKPKAPPIKSQGIKTKLAPFILGSIRWDGKGKWIEPFVGSGAVLFNAAPERALAARRPPRTGPMRKASLPTRRSAPST